MPLLMLWAFLAMAPLARGQDGSADAEVDIPDIGLRNVVGSALGKRTDEAITEAEMATLTQLTGIGHGIESLSGLEFATNLTSLNLGGNRIDDISLLGDLTKLTELDLRSNQIEDASPLADLTALTRLFLQGNRISEVSWLGDLASLAELDLGGNDIVDIAPLVTLADLEWLNLQGNPLDDQSVETHIADLRERGVAVLFHDDHGNQMSTATPVVLGATTAGKIEPHYDVDYFRFEVAEAADVGVFANGDYFQARLLDESGTELQPGGSRYYTAFLIRRHLAPGVYFLELRGSGEDDYLAGAVVDIAVDISDPNLRASIEADLGKTSGETVTSGEMAAFLQTFYAWESQIRDLTGLEFAISLKDELWLRENEISDLSPLSRLTNLQSLVLSDNAVADISPLADLTSLVRLSLAKNRIRDVSPLGNLPLLTGLSLSENEISNVEPLANVTALRTLHLGANDIEDISAMTSLTNLEWVDVRNNPLSAESIDVHIPALEAKGVEVLALGDDHGDSPATATPIDLDEVVSGKINAYFDEDYFRLEIETAASVDIFTTGASNTDGRLLDHDGKELARDNTEGESANFLFRRYLVPGVYYVVVGAIKGERSYRLHAVAGGIDVDFPDSVLRGLVEHALFKRPGEAISSAELATLMELHPVFGIASSTGITDLTGLEFAESLTSLQLTDGEIEDLSPLSGLTSLKQLILSNHKIVDLSSLSGLENLKVLTLVTNDLADISVLSDLTSLTHLDLQDNRIADISALRHLANLQVLDLGGNEIEDISPLMELANLKRLNVGNNPLNAESTDIHIPALEAKGVVVDELDDRHGDSRQRATDLVVGDMLRGEIFPYYDEDYFRFEISETKEMAVIVGSFAHDVRPIVRLLDAEGVEIEHANGTYDHALIQRQLVRGVYYVEVSVGSAASNWRLPYDYSVTALEVIDVHIPDVNLRGRIESLFRYTGGGTITSADMATLTRLQAGGGIVDLTGLEFAIRLTYLSLAGNAIRDLSPLAELTDLESLFLAGNRIADLAPLAGLSGLRELTLNDNPITDLSPLSRLLGLAALNLAGNGLRDISALSSLTNLYNLDLSRNDIVDLSPLAAHAKLTELDLSSNDIMDISTVSKLVELRTLNLEDNRIVDVSPLMDLPRLWDLKLGGNEIVDISPLLAMPFLSSLDVRNNPLNERSIDVHIRDLRDRGVRVSFEDDHGNTREAATVFAFAESVFGWIYPHYDEDHLRLDITVTKDAVITVGFEERCTVELTDESGRLLQRTTDDSRVVMREVLAPGAYYFKITCETESDYWIATAERVNFLDARLEAKVKEELGKVPGSIITSVDMASLDSLEAFREGITNLKGLEFATGLTKLVLSENRIEDISPLAGLVKLTQLNLSDNAIVDISPLRDLTELTVLSLQRNRIVDIAPLAGLTNLQYLILAQNEIVDLPSLGRLNRLEGLYLRGNRIVDVTPLGDLPHVLWLDLRENEIVDISPLAGVTYVLEIYLADNLIVDVSPLVEADMPQLYVLDLRRNPLNSESTRVHVPALREQGVNVALEDAHGDTLETATSLRLGDVVSDELNPAFDKDYLRFELVSSTDVVIFSAGILDTEGRLLDAAGNELAVSDDGGAGYFNFHIWRRLDPGTYYLEVSLVYGRTGQYSIGLIENVQVSIPDANLRVAVESALRKPRGATINSADIVKLNYLRAADARIVDLSGLDTAFSLRTLIVPDNAITDVSPLVDLPSLGFVDLRRNPLNADSLNRHIPTLLSRGVFVVLFDLHGDTPDKATSLALGSAARGLLNPSYDKDYFRVEIGYRTKVTVFTASPFDPYGRLLDETGRELSASEDEGDDKNFRIERVVEPGVYYVEVSSRSTGRDSVGPYLVHANGTPVTPPPSVFAEIDENVLTVGWGAMPRAGVTSYRVVATPVGGGESLTCEVAAEQTHCIFEGVPADAVYNVTVQAIGSGGDGPVATIVSENAGILRTMWRGWRLDILNQAAETAEPEEAAAPAAANE
ncbi:MAG: leucine-rich repeat domain-containing protein [Gammaproteobacteria bacterium]|nr:leucine-rich repeat domain-containing protein [Gammaproteobacteria bacterium]